MERKDHPRGKVLVSRGENSRMPRLGGDACPQEASWGRLRPCLTPFVSRGETLLRHVPDWEDTQASWEMPGLLSLRCYVTPWRNGFSVRPAGGQVQGAPA